MTTELKRCGHCGGEAHKSEANGQDKKYLTIGCIDEDCPAPKMFWEFDEISLQDAIKAWNHRPLEKQARLEALQECLKVCNDFSTKYFNDAMGDKPEELKREDRDRRFGFDVTGNIIQALIDKEKGES